MISGKLKGYSNYEIFEDGSVKNLKFGWILAGCRNPAGYYLYRLTSDNGVTKTFGRHVLIAEVFIPKNWDYDQGDLVVNHKNGIKGDDRIENLEWCTPKENLEHAGRLGLTSKCIPILARNHQTKEIREFKSMIEAARFFNMPKDSIQYRVKIGPEVIFPEGWQYQRLHGFKEWPSGRSKEVLVRDAYSHKEEVFKNLAELCRAKAISPASGTTWIELPYTPVLPGYFQMKYRDDPQEWSEHNDPAVSLALHNKTTPIYTFDQKTKVRMRTYSSAKECADALGLKPTTFAERFKGKDSIVISGITYSKTGLL